MIHGEITEIGCEKKYNHKSFFPKVNKYICSNIDRDFDVYLNITNNSLQDSSVDNFLCISVLEHIFDVQNAFREIYRTLKPGGKLLLTIPFAFPIHDKADYWRLSPDSYHELLKEFEIIEFIHLGGTLSSVSDFLKRPRKKINKRFFLYKCVGLITIILAKYFDTLDNLPLGFAVVAAKKQKTSE